MNELTSAIQDGWGNPSRNACRRRWTEHTFMASACAVGLVGDFLCLLAVLREAYFLAHQPAAAAPDSTIISWLFTGLGVVIFIGTFAYVGIYSRECVLDRRKQMVYLIEAWFVASVVFFGTTTLPVSTVLPLRWGGGAAAILLPLLLGWRLLLQTIMRSDPVTQRLRQRVIILGWSDSAARLTRHTWELFAYPCEIIGYVELQPAAADGRAAPPTVPCLGATDHLPAILQEHEVDVAFLAGTDYPAADILELAKLCQREMAEFKVIPSYFPALVSGMHIEWVSGVPILGTDRLRMNRLHNRLIKRAIDILGAIVGLILASPLIALFGLLVYWESPGPVFYCHCRLGIKGRPFQMIKIRSMHLNADRCGTLSWTAKNDPRRLKIGKLMRRWNIDELPQFWNVLKGDMSLVGPRPELPQSIANFKPKVLHYSLRHSVKPGLTGWAQVNGLRGDTDISERILHDLFYMDNWSLLLDVQTLIMTFFNYQNAA